MSHLPVGRNVFPLTEEYIEGRPDTWEEAHNITNVERVGDGNTIPPSLPGAGRNRDVSAETLKVV